MKAIVLNLDSKEKISLTDVQESIIGPGEVRVKIKAAALNHRDEWSRQGLYPNLKSGIILGSDGAGVVSEVAKGVDTSWIGKEVIINASINWGDKQSVQGKNFEILGMPRNGTFAENVVVPVDRLYQKPDHLTWEEAAALPLAGLTAYRALTYQGQLEDDENVLITGFGGGVAQFAAQFALALGAKVSISSSSPDKIKKGLKMGASFGFDYTNPNWVDKAIEATQGGFDLIIDGAAGDSFNQLIQVCKPGGRIVFYGATRGNPGKLEARRIFWNQLKIMGSTMGSDKDFRKMIQLIEQKEIHPVIDQVFPLEKAIDAFDRMRAGEQMGKIILKP
ncbi:MAG: zinc-binding dehydrogenase [Algoriphagus sp.]|nr:zinc-binding dehydrogenase [Algoriphagus sp.]